MKTLPSFSLTNIVIILLAVQTVRPTPIRRFLADCSNPVVCTKSGPVVCGTDGHTYTNMCTLDREAQIQHCRLGILNPVSYLRDGRCHKIP